MTALYLGPVFESRSHGYDTRDYRQVDRRLGSNVDLARLSEALHAAGIRLGLDSVIKYEAWKGLWSSHNAGNYFEMAWTLRRQFGEAGLYRGKRLYAFADNHDVDRLASTLRDPAHLYPLSILLYAMPGIPSIYYGSEWGIGGRKAEGDDSPPRRRRSAEHVRDPAEGHEERGGRHPVATKAQRSQSAARDSECVLTKLAAVV